MDIIIKPSTKKPWYDRSPVYTGYNEDDHYVGNVGGVTLFYHDVPSGKKTIVIGGVVTIQQRVTMANARVYAGYRTDTLLAGSGALSWGSNWPIGGTEVLIWSVPAPYGYVLTYGRRIYVRFQSSNSSNDYAVSATLQVADFDA